MSDEGDKLASALREAEPSWKADGLGVRGPQDEKSRYSMADQADQVRRSDAPSGSVSRESPQPAFPERETSDGGINADVVDVYGAVDGEPFLFHLYQSSSPTAVEPEE